MPTRPHPPEVPGGPNEPADVVGSLIGFARLLRDAGLPASTDRVESLLTAAAALGVTDSAGVYWAGRLCLCADPEDLPVYDAAFAAWFGGERRPERPSEPVRLVRGTALFADERPTTTSDADPPPLARASATELLRRRDLASLSAAERAEVHRLIALLTPLAPTRPGRRRRRGHRGEVDRPRTARRMLAAAGEPVGLSRHRHRPRPRRVILLIDVSGSMEPYADALLRFGHAAVRCRPASCEAFTLGTRLTRVSVALRHRDPDLALRLAGAAVPDWSGGTRLGESLRAFLDRWGQRGAARRSVVVLFSDGWERGDPALLASQMARLARLAHRVIWVNPHRGRRGYAPVAGGMAAALPHVDDFVAGHSVQSLAELVRVMAHA